MHEIARGDDSVNATLTQGSAAAEGGTGYGLVIAELFDKDGNLKGRCVTKNLITNVGDQQIAARGIGTTVAVATGMKLGTGNTAVSKSGAGSALVTYLSGSNKAFDATYPSVATNVISYKRTWAAGEATTASPITEVVVVNDTIGTDATSTAANTISRALLAGIGSKGASDTLAVTWTHTWTGS